MRAVSGDEGDLGLTLGREDSWERGMAAQYPENSMDREAWRAVVHEVAESDTAE